MHTVDIDTGGTMTDALVIADGRAHTIKVDTTPHDLTVCFHDCLRRAARLLDYDGVSHLLADVGLIRWSSTITSNVLGERRGPKVGVLVEDGHTEDLYGQRRSPAVGTILDERNVVGLPPRPAEEVVLRAVRRLLEDGVRRICVSLPGAFDDDATEQRVKRVIERQYPDHYLGSVPVLVGSEMAQTPDDRTRTHYAIIDAYTNPPLAASLFRAEDRLKDEFDWDRPLYVGHANGGVARIGKTKAVDTIESGPVFGTYAGAYFARRYGLDEVLCLDIGGTTAKASLVRDGRPVEQRGGDIFGIPVDVTMTLLRSIALGGGSIVRPEGSDVRLGPQSMGASPGPACYGLGGTEATLTDAFLVLGYLEPERFLGGRRTLSAEHAREAFERRVAGPLGVPVEQAATAAAERAWDVVADLARGTMDAGGASSPTLFAFGGNGPVFAAPLAQRLGIDDVRLFLDLGPLLGAFGSAVSDVMHVYEEHIADGVRNAVPRLADRARRDLAAEGLDPNEAELTAELVTRGGELVARVPADDVVAVTAVEAAEVARLRARWRLVSYEPAEHERVAASAAPVGSRQIHLDGERVAADLRELSDVDVGATVDGPAIIAGGSTTVLVPGGWRLEVDSLRTARLRST